MRRLRRSRTGCRTSCTRTPPGRCSGSPHSSHSMTVSGRVGSRIVVSASTNGTPAWMPRERVGRQVRDRAHQQAAGAAARARRAGPALVQPSATRCARAGDEVGERVALGQHLALLVPVPAQLAAAADVRDGEDDAAVEQREPGHRELRVDARSRRSRSRRAARAPCRRRRRPLRCDERDRHPGAIVGGRPDPVLLVVGRVEVTEHRLLLEQRQRAGRDVVVVHGRRGDQRAVAQPQLAGRELRVVAGGRRCRWARRTRWECPAPPGFR